MQFSVQFRVLVFFSDYSPLHKGTKKKKTKKKQEQKTISLVTPVA